MTIKDTYKQSKAFQSFSKALEKNGISPLWTCKAKEVKLHFASTEEQDIVNNMRQEYKNASYVYKRGLIFSLISFIFLILCFFIFKSQTTKRTIFLFLGFSIGAILLFAFEMIMNKRYEGTYHTFAYGLLINKRAVSPTIMTRYSYRIRYFADVYFPETKACLCKVEIAASQHNSLNEFVIVYPAPFNKLAIEILNDNILSIL